MFVFVLYLLRHWNWNNVECYVKLNQNFQIYTKFCRLKGKIYVRFGLGPGGATPQLKRIETQFVWPIFSRLACQTNLNLLLQQVVQEENWVEKNEGKNLKI